MIISKKEKIINESIDILIQAGQEGKKYKDMMEILKEKLPDFPENTIHGTVWKLHKETDEIKKIGRGHFIHKSFLSIEDMEDKKITLSDFLNRNDYNIIVNYLDEFKDHFEKVEIEELSKLDDESLKRFNTLLKISSYI